MTFRQLVYAVCGVLAWTSVPFCQECNFERIGLSELELELVEDSRISCEKARTLHKAGISLEEYFQYPWLRAGLSEEQWVQARSSGRLENTTETGRRQGSSEWAVVQNFFLPGFNQYRRGQVLKGLTMSALAAGSVALFALHRNPRQDDPYGFDYLGYLAILGADQLWSSIDIGIQLHRDTNPDAQRFSAIGKNTEVALSIRIPLQTGTD